MMNISVVVARGENGIKWEVGSTSYSTRVSMCVLLFSEQGIPVTIKYLWNSSDF